MMKSTHPAEYAQLKHKLRPVTQEVILLVDRIMDAFSAWNVQLDESFPKVRSLGRPTREDIDWVSVETYLRCELMTYSENTLSLCLQDIHEAQMQGVNLSELNLRLIAKGYGFPSLEDMEANAGNLPLAFNAGVCDCC
jgi:hypothetical protein